MITEVQCKMARAALGWGVRDLASRAQVGATTVVRFENGKSANASTLKAMRAAFEENGVHFSDDGNCVCAPPKKSEA
jgi:transcriptional regulator with XRE-family HTH domain